VEEKAGALEKIREKEEKERNRIQAAAEADVMSKEDEDKSMRKSDLDHQTEVSASLEGLLEDVEDGLDAETRELQRQEEELLREIEELDIAQAARKTRQEAGLSMGESTVGFLGSSPSSLLDGTHPILLGPKRSSSCDAPNQQQRIEIQDLERTGQLLREVKAADRRAYLEGKSVKAGPVRGFFQGLRLGDIVMLSSGLTVKRGLHAGEAAEIINFKGKWEESANAPKYFANDVLLHAEYQVTRLSDKKTLGWFKTSDLTAMVKVENPALDLDKPPQKKREASKCPVNKMKTSPSRSKSPGRYTSPHGHLTFLREQGSPPWPGAWGRNEPWKH